MEVNFLDQTYLNDRAQALDIKINVDPDQLAPIALTGTGITLARTLRKVIMDEVPVYAPKSTMNLDHYEQADAQGNSYLHESYSKFQVIQDPTALDYFQDLEKYQQYQANSGYAKVVVADKEGRRLYNGDEHTQVLTDRWGFLPINSHLSYLLDNKRSPPVRVPLEQIWLFLGQVPPGTEILPSLEMISPIEFTKTNLESVETLQSQVRLQHLTVAKSLLVLYCDVDPSGRTVWYNLTGQVIPKYDRKGLSTDPGALFPYNTLLLSLKPGQRIKAHCRLEKGTGRQYAKWQPGIVRYKFATQRDLVGPDVSDTQLPETNDQQRQFVVSRGKDPLMEQVFLNEPETIILTLQSIGRLEVPVILERALATMRIWLGKFRNSLLDTTRFYHSKRNSLNDFIAENLHVKVEHFEYPELVLQVDNCHGSYLPLLVDSFLRSLVARVRDQQDDPNSPVLQTLRQFKDLLEHHRKLSTEKKYEESQFRQDRTAVPKLTEAEEKVIKELTEWIGKERKYVQKITQTKQAVTPVQLEEIQFALNTHRIQTKPFEDRYAKRAQDTTAMTGDNSRGRLPSSKIEGESSEARLVKLLEKTILSTRLRHPLRNECYLTLKYPEELLETITPEVVQQYFYEGQYGKGNDQNLLNFYRILTLTLQFLDELDGKVATLELLLKTKIREKTQLNPNFLRQCRSDFNYHAMLNQQVITKYHQDLPFALPYVEHQLHSGTPVRGQRKLFLTEVLFLSKYLTPETQKEYLVVYAGAADGSHQTVLNRMFPDLKFALFDPKFGEVLEAFRSHQSKGAIFTMGRDKVKMLSGKQFGRVEDPVLNEKEDEDGIDFNTSHNYYIFPCFCTAKIAPSLARLAEKAGNRKLLFISDLRVIPQRGDLPMEAYDQLVQQQVYDDNYLQYSLINSLDQTKRLTAAMIKFRFPYHQSIPSLKLTHLAENHRSPDQKIDNPYFGANQFYKGEIFIQPYAPGSTTEARLIVDQTVLQQRQPLMTYNDLHYEQFFSYINNVVRRSMKFYTPQLSFHWDRNYDLNCKYDHLLELLILNSYVVNFKREEIAQGRADPLELLWEELRQIETNQTMKNLNWKGTL